MLFRIVLLACVASLAVSFSVQDCQFGRPGNGHTQLHGKTCYKFLLGQKKTYQAAAKYCQDTYGGSLALIKSENTNRYLKHQIKNLVGEHSAWIGVTWVGVEEKFLWSDGSDVKFSRLPKDAMFKGCGAVRPGQTDWDFHRCENAKLNFVCQYNPVHTTKKIGDCPKAPNVQQEMFVFKDHCYSFQAEEIDYVGAENVCSNLGGKLVVLKDPAVNHFVELTLASLFRKHHHNKHDAVWIGLRTQADGETIKWSDGSLLRKGLDKVNLNVPPQDCFAIKDNKWHPFACPNIMDDFVPEMHPFICQI